MQSFAMVIGRRPACLALLGAALASASACSSSSPSTTPVHDAGPGDAAVTCASPGVAVAGPPTNRCDLPDGGLIVQPVDPASCMARGDGGSAPACAYGDTLFGQDGPDDDCKYHVAWTSTPICQGSPGVVITLVATFLGTNAPVTGAQVNIEYYVPEQPDAGGCHDTTMHLGPTLGSAGLYQMMETTTPGTYVGQIVFDQTGEWTMRFHFDENCLDLLDDSPHGHVAFHLSVP
jgi:hypothetical protein